MKNVSMDIRLATINDINILQKIGRQTFYETFVDTNTKQDMQDYLDKNFSTQKLTQELNNPCSSFYIAQSGGQIIGYLKINWAQSQTEINDDKALEIERIYVLQECFGKQIGLLLYQQALQIAQDKNMEYIWLGVWEHNPRAIRFYEKNGFVAFDKHIFRVGTDDQTDLLMKLNL